MRGSRGGGAAGGGRDIAAPTSSGEAAPPGGGGPSKRPGGIGAAPTSAPSCPGPTPALFSSTPMMKSPM
ncbi:MAG: hypothetical protein H6708_20085 [Kofleriaceae bacterium]|nr:hypothetical protein [Kofleriaceae bacterium]